MKSKLQHETSQIQIAENSINKPPVGSGYEALLDSNEAAELLRIHPKTLQRMARNGEIPAIQIGRLWRFRASALNAWVSEKLVG